MTINLPTDVVIEEESLRDGLQNEERRFSVEEKLWFIRELEKSGLTRIQVGSFVHPEWVPQMADTDEVFAQLEPTPGVTYTALILNERGLERALTCRVSHLSMSMSASETHGKKNTNRTIAEAKTRIRGLIEKALADGIRVRAGVMSAFGCAYEGKVSIDQVLDIVGLYGRLGVHEVNLADTAGLANPRSVDELVGRAGEVLGDETALSLHLHDTRGLGLANLVAGIQAGVRLFDTSMGGLGGCPFIPDAAGNIATEDAVHLLDEMGVGTGIDWRSLSSLALGMERRLGRTLPSRMAHLPDTVA